MTPRRALRRRLGWRCLKVLLILALAWSPAVQAIADDQPPPPPTGLAQMLTLAPAQPAACTAGCLYDQMDSPSAINSSSSQNSTDDQYDTRAADDFFVTPGSNSWHITAVEVTGNFAFGLSDNHSVNSVNVEFYADSAGLPGYRLYTANAVPISGTASSGAFYVPLSPTVELASNATYWVSVQAIQSTSWYWYWVERTTQTRSESVWQNPSNVFLRGCLGWTAIKTCYSNADPDLLFRLYGTQSANQVTPILLSLDPNHAANRGFTLNANGIGFANGAVLNWTVGTTKHFSTTVSSAARLSAFITAADVSSYGATVTVSVTNPGPCSQSCTSNVLTFAVKNLLFLPLVRH